VKLLALRLYRFGSFVEEQQFVFPSACGLYFMQGRNDAEPRLGPNGAGKTTLWAALYWVLFGKTPRGLKAGDVANWEEGKGSWVELDFTLDGNEDCLWTMKRSWSPNSWTLHHIAGFITDEEVVDLTKDPTNPVLQALRLDALSFLNCVLMAQGQPMFLDQEGGKKAEIFSSIMGLDRWLEFSKRASERAGTSDRKLRELERSISELRGQLDASMAADLERCAQDWERERAARLDAVEREHLQRAAKLKPLREREEAILNGLAVVRANLREALSIEASLTPALEDADKALREAERVLDQADAKVNQLKSQAKLKEGKCSSCGQEVTPAVAAQHQQEHDRQLRFAEEDARSAFAKMKKREIARDSTRERCAAASEAVRLHGAGVDDLERALSDTRRAMQVEERALDQLEEDSERIEKESNPHERLHQQAQREAEDVRVYLERKEAEAREEGERHYRLSYWVRGFKEIRLQEITAALDQLEIEANNELEALGLIGWDLLFDVDRETKGGNLQRGFAVRVRSPHNPRSVPWEAWSGGESQRLRLGAQMGLSNLTRQQTGTPLDLEVWDEPTQWMSPQGVTDLLDALARRAQKERRQIWVVDHRSLGYGNWSGSCVVAKTAKGSQFIQE
jgi:DNA repair exonuclease SbcCD ATPase subunit